MNEVDLSNKKVWKVAVIGCGAFANWQYLPNIRKEASADIVAAVDIIPQRAQKACEEYNIPNWYDSVYALIENRDFDIGNRCGIYPGSSRDKYGCSRCRESILLRKSLPHRRLNFLISKLTWQRKKVLSLCAHRYTQCGTI